MKGEGNEKIKLFTIGFDFIFFVFNNTNSKERISILEGKLTAEKICSITEPLIPGWTSISIDDIPVIFCNLNGDTILYLYGINDAVDLVLFFSLRSQYAAVGDCCYPICRGALLRIDIKSTESIYYIMRFLHRQLAVRNDKFLNFAEVYKF